MIRSLPLILMLVYIINYSKGVVCQSPIYPSTIIFCISIVLVGLISGLSFSKGLYSLIENIYCKFKKMEDGDILVKDGVYNYYRHPTNHHLPYSP